MIFLPIVARELRVAARRRATYRTRFWTALITIGIGSYLVMESRAMVGASGGTMVFDALVALCFLSCLSLAGNTSDSISEEKRDGTLGFLFLTDLKGHDVALGKLVSASLISFYSLIAVLPIVTVSLLLGGITVTEVWQVALALLNTFFFSQCAGLFVSAFSRKRASATFFTAAILMCYTLGFYLLCEVPDWKQENSWIRIFQVLNPVYCVQWACTMGTGSVYGQQFGEYWKSLLVVHLNAWAFLIAASWWLPRSWQERAVAKKAGYLEQFRLWYHSKFTPRAALLDRNPFLWLTIRNRLGALRIWITLGVYLCFWLWVLTQTRFAEAGVFIVCSAILLNHVTLKIFAASEVTNNMEEQRRGGGLELLLSCTPLKVEEIVQGQWLALWRQLLWPVVTVLVTDLLMILAALHYVMRNDSSDERADFVLVILAVMVMLVPDMFALGWVGMWHGMSQKKPRHAAGTTIAQVLLLPWVILIGFQFLTAIGGRPFADSLAAAVALWFILGIIVDVLAISLARPRLLDEFRALAIVQQGEGIGFLGSVGRLFGELAADRKRMS